MYTFATISAALLAAAGAVTAAPAAKVSNYPLTTGCSRFPGYTAGSNVTDPTILQFVGSTAPVNGQGLTTFEYYVNNHGRFTLPVAPDLAKQVIRCNQSTAAANKGAPFFEVRLADQTWTPLQIFIGTNHNGALTQLVYGARTNATQLVRGYTHNKDGSGGIFLGGTDANTAFATGQEFYTDDDHSSFNYVRYIPTGTQLAPAEFSGFVQVYGS